MPPASDNVYVTNLPPGFTQQDVETVFGQYGIVSQCRVLSSAPGQRCAALVRFPSVEEALTIVQELDGAVLIGLSDPVQLRFADTPEIKAQKYGKMATNGPSLGGKAVGNGFGKGSVSAPYSAVPNKSSPPPSDNLYITNLPADMDEVRLRMIFGGYGLVRQCRLLKPSPSGKVPALVRYSSDEEAARVKSSLDGAIPEGLEQPVFVDYADPPGSSNNTIAKAPESDKLIMVIVNGFEDAGCMPGGKWQNNESTIYVAGLPPDTTDYYMYRLFSPFGAIAAKGVRAVQNPDGTCKGFGFVNYLNNSSAAAAIHTISGTRLPDGSMIKVSIKT